MLIEETESRDDRLPLYQRLRDDFAAKIERQVWRAGDALPAETLLAKEYDVAPGTVRKAIDALVHEGQLERRQGSGTYVRRPDFRSSLFRFFRYASGAQFQSVPESEILTRRLVPPSPMVADKLMIADTDNAIFMDRIRLLAGRPLLTEEIWLPEARFAKLLDLPKEDFGNLLYPLYEQKCGQVVARATERLTAESANEYHAERLKIPVHSAVIVIERLTFGFDNMPIEWRRSRGPAERFAYEAEIR